MPTVVLIGTLDTKGAEFDFVRRRIKQHGAEVILVDAGVLGAPPIKPTITREEVARAAGAEIAALATSGDRGAAVMTMARGAAEIAKRLYAEKRLDGIMGMGGSGNSSSTTAGAIAWPGADRWPG